MDDQHHQDDPEESNDPVIWSRYQQDLRAAHVAANDAFVAAMNREIGKGRVKAKFGTTVDSSPPIGARRISAPLPMSACGSPSAMCMESGGAHSGAGTMK